MVAFPKKHASCLEYRQRLLAGAFTARQGIERYLERVTAIDAELRALLEVFPEHALAEAEEVDRRLAGGASARPLEGIPFTAKANICTRTGTTDAGSRLLAGFRSPVEATAVARLRAAGAVLVGKTNLDEFGMGSSCENS